MDAKTLIEKLRSTASSGPLRNLATIAVDAGLNQPVDRQALVVGINQHLATAFRSWARAPEGLALLTHFVEGIVHELSMQAGRVGDMLPRDLRHAARSLVERPFSPDRQLVLSVLDREPIRELVRDILQQAIVGFAQKLGTPVAGAARGFGALAKLAQETIKSRSAAIGDLMGAVSTEVERQVERRAAEFVEAALSGILGQIADVLCDRSRAAEAAELRLALFDGVMNASAKALSVELINADISGAAEALRSGFLRWINTDDATKTLQELANFLADFIADRSLRDVLLQMGLFDVVRAIAVDFVAQGMAQTIASETFRDWLAQLGFDDT